MSDLVFSQVFAPDLSVTMFRDLDGVLTPMPGEAGAAFYTAGNVASDAPVDNVEHLYIEGRLRGRIGFRWFVRTLNLLSPRRGPSRWLGCILNPSQTSILLTSIKTGWLISKTCCCCSATMATGGASDVNGDGTVDFQDLVALLAVWS